MSEQIETRLADVVFPFFSGKAGLRVKDGTAELAYQGRPPRVATGSGTIDGERYVVVAARSSEITRGFTVLTIQQDA